MAGNNPNFYSYTIDSNTWVDPFGLDIITVYRFEQRFPAEIKAGRGFNVKVPNSNIDLLDYAANNTPSQYISTTYDINSAMDFGNDYFGKNAMCIRLKLRIIKG